VKRRQARTFGGRFTRNTPENTFGLHMNIHDGNAPDGSWCGRFNPTQLGEPRPERCQCGALLQAEEPKT
jgi:hypothetical protein